MAGVFEIGAIPYRPELFDSFAAVEDKMAALIGQVADHGARLAILPEYAAMELAGISGAAAASDLQRAIDAVAARLPSYDALCQRLATENRIAILAGSAPVRAQGGNQQTWNVAKLFSPTGKVGVQAKQIVTPFERENWNIHNGVGLQVFDLGFVHLGINICYDVEFPLLARAQCEAGAELILCPSCTDSLAGFYRVRTGALARALENQCYVAQVPLVGVVDWCPAIDENHGAAAVYGPSDVGFPDNGIVAEGAMDDETVLYATVDLDKVRHVRQSGQVLNYQNWDYQCWKNPPAGGDRGGIANASIVDLA